MTGKPAQDQDLAAENGRILSRIVLILLVVLLLINIPISSWGASLLQMMPQDVTPVALRDGMVLQNSQGDRYLLHNQQLRPFGSPEAYERYGRRYGRQVQPVADRIINGYQSGPPIYHLIQCEWDATIYALENGERRPFLPAADTPFPYTNATWDQIELVDCQQLEALPIGQLITE
jgi:hypothetical protein